MHHLLVQELHLKLLQLHLDNILPHLVFLCKLLSLTQLLLPRSIHLKEWRELIGEVYARSRDYRFFEQDVTSDCAALRIPPPASEAALALSVRMAGWIAELIQ